MKKMIEKLRARGGFTLVEMLIVVAIIAILIAVSIPLVANSLESAREATDAANERAFKAELAASYLLHEAKMKGDTSAAFQPGVVYCYDAPNGTFVLGTDADLASTIKPYGQGTATSGTHKENGEHKGKRLFGYINESTGKACMAWRSEAAVQQTSSIDSEASSLTSLLIVDSSK